MKKFNIVHPFLFAINPILSLWSINIAYVPFSEVQLFLLTSIFVTPVLMLIGWIALKDWKKVSLLVSGFLFLFYSYGYVSNEIKSLLPLDDHLNAVKILAPLWIGLYILWLWITTKKINNLSSINAMFFWIGILTLAASLFQIVGFYTDLSQNKKPLEEDKVQFQNQFHWEGETELPDVYYIILDAYGREDILTQLYDYDNSEFIGYLSDKGFYVSNKSTSNYNQTALSLSSSLNLEYINYYENILGKKSDNRKPLADMIKNSYVRTIFEANGYQLATGISGYNFTEIKDAAINLSIEEKYRDQPGDKNRTVNAYEWLLIESTGFQGIFDIIIISLGIGEQDQNPIDTRYQTRREEIRNTFDNLDEIADQPGSYFVFIHIIAPHPPFIFTEDGGKVKNVGIFTIRDGNHLTEGREDYREIYNEGYVDQIKYINQMTTEAIDRILEKSETPPIIVLQADHGPGAYLYWDSVEKSNMPERLSILNAYYFPDGNYDLLYPSISPVNTFRVVFNTYFGGEFEILEDKSYFSLWDYPYDFVDVTYQLNR